jgi:hypothetical protein
MERSASESVLAHSDYRVQKVGIDPRTTGGKLDKDTGEFTSEMNRTVKQALKTPGPGKYVAHKNWEPKTAGANQGNRFTKSTKGHTALNTVPPPHQYERKDIATMPSMKGKECLSGNPRVTLGKLSKGDRRSFIEKSIKFSLTLPGPSTYHPVGQRSDRLDSKMGGTLDWKRQMIHSTSRLGNTKDKLSSQVGPNSYQINWEATQYHDPAYSVPKDPCANFLDKAVKETYSDYKTKKEKPGPATYPKDGSFKFEKLSHGPIQKSPLARAALSTYF